MGGAARGGPEPLRLLALRDVLTSHLDQIVDQRQAAKVWSRRSEPVTALTPAWRVIVTLHDHPSNPK